MIKGNLNELIEREIEFFDFLVVKKYEFVYFLDMKKNYYK